MSKKKTIDKRQIKEAVREHYGKIATQAKAEETTSCCPSSSCCIPEEVCTAVALYSQEELYGLPPTVAEMAMGCGNPTAIAGLKPGEVVLDLGSGGGIDVFLAARQVGPMGKVIGLDMTKEMIELAQKSAQKVGAQNVEFRLGEMEDMPLEDESVDVIISNCVINLSPDKDRVFAEAYRVLRPGGRMVISDLVTEGGLPPAVKESVEAWVGCVAGAMDKREYLEKIEAAGFIGLKSRVGRFADSEGADSEEIYPWVKHIDVDAHKPT